MPVRKPKVSPLLVFASALMESKALDLNMLFTFGKDGASHRQLLQQNRCFGLNYSDIVIALSNVGAFRAFLKTVGFVDLPLYATGMPPLYMVAPCILS
jgi:hypothetical protein